MHAMFFGGPMFLVGMILHLTLILVLSFFVLFAAQKATGLVKLLGNVVGVWLLVLAILIIVAHATAPMFGGRIFGMGPMMDRHVEVRISNESRSETTAPTPAPAAAPANAAHP
ncbi:MAG: hypothetical protein HY054_16320 [Proteobacteria bacterium]|nr:hypothetical protein [Pseudomonadota bacterium]